jgi:hypothetical protein
VRSAARSAAAGDSGEARDRARGNAIFSKKNRAVCFLGGFWRLLARTLARDISISAAFSRALRFSFPVVELVFLFRRLLNSCARAR